MDMKTKIRLIGIVFSILFLTACGKKADDTIEIEKIEQTESAIEVDDSIGEKDSLQGFILGDIKAYRDEDEEGFYIQNLQLATDEEDMDYFKYSLGEMVDIDNDEEDELIIDGPYGGMYLDYVDDKVGYLRGLSAETCGRHI